MSAKTQDQNKTSSDNGNNISAKQELESSLNQLDQNINGVAKKEDNAALVAQEEGAFITYIITVSGFSRIVGQPLNKDILKMMKAQYEKAEALVGDFETYSKTYGFNNTVKEANAAMDGIVKIKNNLLKPITDYIKMGTINDAIFAKLKAFDEGNEKDKLTQENLMTTMKAFGDFYDAIDPSNVWPELELSENEKDLKGADLWNHYKALLVNEGNEKGTNLHWFLNDSRKTLGKQIAELQKGLITHDTKFKNALNAFKLHVSKTMQ